jgi:hypothetical protein
MDIVFYSPSAEGLFYFMKNELIIDMAPIRNNKALIIFAQFVSSSTGGLFLA